MPTVLPTRGNEDLSYAFPFILITHFISDKRMFDGVRHLLRQYYKAQILWF